MLVGATGPLVSVLFSRKFCPNDRKALVATHARRHDGAACAEDRRLRAGRLRLLGMAAADRGDDLSGFLGTIYGTQLLDRLPEETFRKWFRIGITVLALDLCGAA